jgi:hypothetical protein
MLEQAITQIAQTGLLGAFLLVAGFAIVKLYGKVEEERDERLADMKQVWQQDIQFRTELKNLLDRILEILRGKR